jgi:uncharacterized protein YprB with RNaseH-like and TPR domain
MEGPQEQLAALRRRIARIDAKYRSGWRRSRAEAAAPAGPAQYFVEDWLSGEQVETEHGAHFETEKLYGRTRRHGSVGVADLIDLPAGLLRPLSEGAVSNCAPSKWAFLDTETAGLAGGAGAYAFLAGVGRIAPDGFRIRQFLMRELAEERSVLSALAAHLAQFDVLITYNGKTFDEPLLETRYRTLRLPSPFRRLQHLDLLVSARRLWKLRFDSCRLMDLEQQILGVERDGDLAGELIPYVYCEYLRTREAMRLVPVLHHNAVDILTLACLTAIVPRAFDSPQQAGLNHGAEMAALGRWFLKTNQLERALDLLRKAIAAGVADDILFRALWDIAATEKRLGHDEAAERAFEDLAASPNPFQAAAHEELAKYYEHRGRNRALALEMTRRALAITDTESLRRRLLRLESRSARA